MLSPSVTDSRRFKFHAPVSGCLESVALEVFPVHGVLGMCQTQEQPEICFNDVHFMRVILTCWNICWPRLSSFWKDNRWGMRVYFHPPPPPPWSLCVHFPRVSPLNHLCPQAALVNAGGGGPCAANRVSVVLTGITLLSKKAERKKTKTKKQSGGGRPFSPKENKHLKRETYIQNRI